MGNLKIKYRPSRGVGEPGQEIKGADLGQVLLGNQEAYAQTQALYNTLTQEQKQRIDEIIGDEDIMTAFSEAQSWTSTTSPGEIERINEELKAYLETLDNISDDKIAAFNK